MKLYCFLFRKFEVRRNVPDMLMIKSSSCKVKLIVIQFLFIQKGETHQFCENYVYAERRREVFCGRNPAQATYYASRPYVHV